MNKWRAVGLTGALAAMAAGTVVAAPSASAAPVTAACVKSSDWGTGFEGKCTITNGTTASITSWNVKFTVPNGTTITSSWDAARSNSGTTYTFTNVGWNGTVAPGGTASFGFNGAGTWGISACTVNGASCDGSGNPGGDTQAPSVPGNLRSTGKTSSSVSLAWNASTDNVGVTAYDIYQGGSVADTVSGTSATISGLSANTAYGFTVRAKDAAGNTSGASNSVSVTTDPGGNPGPGGNKVIGYFAQWGVYQRAYHVKNIDTSGSAAKLTHINYAFGNVQNGQCTIGDSYADYDRAYTAAESVDGVADTWDAGALRGSFNQLRKLKRKYPHIKVLFSFGGWTWSGGFPQAAANPTAFANSCYNLVEDPRWADVFDGIDIDWEYPNACGLSCDTTSGPSGYRNLMQALRNRFGSNYLVTSAITADGTSGGKIDAADYAGAAQYVNWYLPMTYDFFGAWAASGPTAPHSPLTSYSGIPTPGFYSDNAIQKLKSKGVPASKLLLGIGFYGRGWTGVSQAAPGGSASGAAPGTYEAGIEDYKVLKGRCPANGTVAGTAYAHCGNQWWSYDTPSTIGGKMTYARNQGLGGAFFWELSGDTTNGELITAMRNGIG